MEVNAGRRVVVGGKIVDPPAVGGSAGVASAVVSSSLPSPVVGVGSNGTNADAGMRCSDIVNAGGNGSTVTTADGITNSTSAVGGTTTSGANTALKCSSLNTSEIAVPANPPPSASPPAPVPLPATSPNSILPL
jgi:hypothetical protein